MLMAIFNAAAVAEVLVLLYVAARWLQRRRARATA